MPLELTRPIGIYGGTFDPPHLGHLILASEALFDMHLEKVLWVLTPDPPHKQGQKITPYQVRLEMLEAALAEHSQFEISMVDIHREPPHYAVDTVRLLKEQFPENNLVYLLGADSLRDLSNWRQPQAFVAACDQIAVMRRPGARMDLGGVEDKVPGLTHKLHVITAPLLEVSSQEIRRRTCSGAPTRYYLHAKVFDIIRNKKLYCDQ